MRNQNDRSSKLLLFISAILGIAFLTMLFLLVSQFSDIFGLGGEEASEPPVTNESSRYDLRQNATPYQVELFAELIEAHERFEQWGSDEALEVYAEMIVQNFIADFYTLSNKNGRNDVGGIQFFSEEVASAFTSYAIDNFYLYLNQHIENFGSDSLPTVASTTVTNAYFDQRVVPPGEDEVNHGHGFGHHVEPNIEYERVIVVYATWTYEHTTLPGINEFQTSARFTLRVVDDQVHIYIIEPIQEQFPYGS